jgi:hypothetical protein
MEHLLHRAHTIDLVSVCYPNFFSGEFLHSLLSVESWLVSPHLQPTQIPAQTFHVYRLIPSLGHHSGMTTLLLPNEGLSLKDAKHVGGQTYHLFAMLALTESFEDTRFRQSIFGQRLRTWSDLPHNPMIHGIWQKSPRQATYFWFQSLQSLCSVFQTWIKNPRYHPMQGFIEARDNTHQSHHIFDSTTP